MLQICILGFKKYIWKDFFLKLYRKSFIVTSNLWYVFFLDLTKNLKKFILLWYRGHKNKFCVCLWRLWSFYSKTMISIIWSNFVVKVSFTLYLISVISIHSPENKKISTWILQELQLHVPQPFNGESTFARELQAGKQSSVPPPPSSSASSLPESLHVLAGNLRRAAPLNEQFELPPQMRRRHFPRFQAFFHRLIGNTSESWVFASR